MLKPLLALSLLAGTAAMAQTPSPGEWTLAGSAEACMIHAASGHGTIVSITAIPGDEAFLFVIQNEQLGALSDGEKYPIAVEFDDLGPWQIEALAQNQLDKDGPGVVFSVRPGRDDGRNFIKEFTAASDMQIGREGTMLDNVAVSDGRAAMTGLATCLGKIWSPSGNGGQGGPLIEVEEGEEAEEPVPL